MAKQNDPTEQETVIYALRELKQEVGSLKAELGRIEGVILKDRLSAVEEALSQNRLMQYADLLNEEASDDIDWLLNSDCEKRIKCHEYFKDQLAKSLLIAKSYESKDALADLDTRMTVLSQGICTTNWALS